MRPIVAATTAFLLVAGANAQETKEEALHPQRVQITNGAKAPVPVTSPGFGYSVEEVTGTDFRQVFNAVSQKIEGAHNRKERVVQVSGLEKGGAFYYILVFEKTM